MIIKSASLAVLVLLSLSFNPRDGGYSVISDGPGTPGNRAVTTGIEESSARSLQAAYSKYIDSIANNTIYWKDGSIMPFSKFDERDIDPTTLTTKEFEALLDGASPQSMAAADYPYLQPVTPPAKNHDPGRARNTDFLKKIYGNNPVEVRKKLQKVVWLRSSVNKTLWVNGENGAAAALQKISDELDKLPKEFLKYLDRPAGTFNWRKVTGTTRLSAHSFGIAIDINVDQSHYWRNARPDASGNYKYKNSIPYEIVEIFERHGWIWGGRWYHYDTMHFEYRPEVVLNKRH